MSIFEIRKKIVIWTYNVLYIVVTTTKNYIFKFVKGLISYAPLLQVLIAFGGLILLYLGYQTVKLEIKKFQLDYGNQIQVFYSGATLYVMGTNELISDIRVKSKVYLELSEDRFGRTNPYFIEAVDIYKCLYPYECLSKYYNRADHRLMSVNGQLISLEMLFNATPTKFYPEIVCLSTVEYSDPQRNYKKEFYYSRGCNLDDWYENFLTRVTEEEANEKINKSRIIGSFDFKRTEGFGFASYTFSRYIINRLSAYTWNKRFIEPSSLRQYRLGIRY